MLDLKVVTLQGLNASRQLSFRFTEGEEPRQGGVICLQEEGPAVKVGPKVVERRDDSVVALSMMQGAAVVDHHSFSLLSLL